MGFLSTNFENFSKSLAQVDEQLLAERPFDLKTDELIRFALSIKARSEPCVRKHYRGSLAAGATEKEIAYIFALTMREAAGADDCWTHGVIGDLVGEESADGCGSCS